MKKRGKKRKKTREIQESRWPNIYMPTGEEIKKAGWKTKISKMDRIKSKIRPMSEGKYRKMKQELRTSESITPLSTEAKKLYGEEGFSGLSSNLISKALRNFGREEASLAVYLMRLHETNSAVLLKLKKKYGSLKEADNVLNIKEWFKLDDKEITRLKKKYGSTKEVMKVKFLEEDYEMTEKDIRKEMKVFGSAEDVLEVKAMEREFDLTPKEVKEKVREYGSVKEADCALRLKDRYKVEESEFKDLKNKFGSLRAALVAKDLEKGIVVDQQMGYMVFHTPEETEAKSAKVRLTKEEAYKRMKKRKEKA